MYRCFGLPEFQGFGAELNQLPEIPALIKRDEDA
jgi:hypothetical protein